MNMQIRKPILTHGSAEYALSYHHFIPEATYEMTPVLTIRDLADLLMEDLRIDEADAKMSAVIEQMLSSYH